MGMLRTSFSWFPLGACAASVPETNIYFVDEQHGFLSRAGALARHGKDLHECSSCRRHGGSCAEMVSGARG